MDTGATVNVIRADCVQALGLRPTPNAKKLAHNVADGRQCVVSHEVRDAAFTIQGFTFKANLQIIPLESKPEWTVLLGLPVFKSYGIDIPCSQSAVRLPTGKVVPWLAPSQVAASPPHVSLVHVSDLKIERNDLVTIAYVASLSATHPSAELPDYIKRRS